MKNKKQAKKNTHPLSLVTDENLGNWYRKLCGEDLLYIAGPCSAETRAQVLTTAQALKGTKVKIFRAGVWKPRTRPGNFEGVGAVALPWLSEVTEKTGLLPAIEVANAHHVRMALEYRIPIVWIGARTTANPFAVQEIADALRGNGDIIVLIKNPVNPDIELWIGALERVYEAGIRSLGLIHRGFSTYKKGGYRNEPNWQIPIEIKTRYPGIPLINDPSHICGRRECIPDVMQMALDLRFDGLMVETHPDPDSAWSDAGQQIKPEKFLSLLQQLHKRKPEFEQDEWLNRLSHLRSRIDEIDRKLIDVLKERNEEVSEIARVKKKQNVAILQPERWREIQKNISLYAGQKGIDRLFVRKLFEIIHRESIKEQEKIIYDKAD